MWSKVGGTSQTWNVIFVPFISPDPFKLIPLLFLACSLHVSLRIHYYIPHDAIRGSFPSPVGEAITPHIHAYIQRLTTSNGSLPT